MTTINTKTAISLYRQLVNATVKLPTGIDFDDAKRYAHNLAREEWESDSMSIAGLPYPLLKDTRVTDEVMVSWLYSLMNIEEVLHDLYLPELVDDDEYDEIPTWEEVIGHHYAYIAYVRGYSAIAEEFPEYSAICEERIAKLVKP